MSSGFKTTQQLTPAGEIVATFVYFRNTKHLFCIRGFKRFMNNCFGICALNPFYAEATGDIIH